MRKIIFYFLFIISSNSFSQANVQYKYDNNNRTVEIQSTNGKIITYSYDPNGNRIATSVTCAIKPKARITPIAKDTICSGDSVILQANIAPSYKWSTGATTSSIAVRIAGDYTLIVSSAYYCSDTTKVTVVVNPLPVLTIVPSTLILCQGMIDTLSASGATAYKWRGTNITDSVSAKTMVIPPIGITSYTLIGTMSSCIASKTISITVNAAPTDIIPTVQTPTVCAGTTASIQIPNSQSGVKYQLRNNGTNAFVGSALAGNSSTLNLSTGALTSTTVFNVLATDTVSLCNTVLSKTLTITVTPLPTLTITASTLSVCQGTIDTLTASGATTYKWSGQNLTDSTSATITINPLNATNTYTVLGTTNGCSAIASITITGNPLPTDIIPIAQSSIICAGTGTNIQIPTSQTGINYQLRNSGTNVLIGNSVAGTGIVINLPTGILTTTTKFTVVATAALSLCSSVMSTGVTVTVTPLPVVTPVVTPNPVCQGGTLTLTASGASSYVWNGPNLVTTIGASVTANTPLLGTLTFTVTGTTNGCSTTATTIATVNPFLTIAITPSATTLCQGTIETLSATGAILYKWSGPNLTDSISAKIIVLPPNGINTYSVIGTSNGCSASKSITVTVNPLPTDIIPVAQSAIICAGTSTNIQIPVSQNGVTYQLRNNGTNALVGTSVSGNGNTINLPTGILTASATFNVLATATFSTCSVVMSATTTVTVNPLPIITPLPPTPNPVCQGGTLTLTVSGATTYSWSGLNLNATTGASVSANPAIFGTINYTVIGISNGCSDSVKFSITVNPGPEITSQPLSAQSLCVNGTPANLTIATKGAGINYQWYSNTNNASSGGTLLNGETAPNCTPPNAKAGTFYYYCIITQSGAACPTIASSVSTVTIVEKPTITIQPLLTQTVCANNTPAILIVEASGGTGNFTYQWFSNTSNSTTNGTLISSETKASFSPPPTSTTGTVYYYCIITQSGIGCGILISNTASVTVSARFNIGIGTNSPNPICAGNLLTLIANGGTSYVWKGPNLNATSGDTVTANPITPGKNTYILIATKNGCSDSIPYDETVVQPPTISQPIVTQSLCLNATPSDLKITVNGPGPFNFQWYSNSLNATTNGTSINNATASTYTPITTVTGTNYYYCVATQPGAVCSTMISATAKVIVIDTIPKITISQTSCIAGTVSFGISTISGGGVSPQYQWQQRKNATLQWTDSVGATGTAFQIAKASNGTQVRLKMTSNATCARPPIVYSDSIIINCAVTAIAPIPASVDSFNVYPNPTDGRFYIYINLNSTNEVSFKLFDPSGRLLYKSPSPKKMYGKNTVQLPVQLVISGTYILHTYIGKVDFPWKIIKQSPR